MRKRDFALSVVHSPEVKRGAAHFIVGVAVGILSLLFGRTK